MVKKLKIDIVRDNLDDLIREYFNHQGNENKKARPCYAVGLFYSHSIVYGYDLIFRP